MAAPEKSLFPSSIFDCRYDLRRLEAQEDRQRQAPGQGAA
jgi:hypothetical protein